MDAAVAPSARSLDIRRGLTLALVGFLPVLVIVSLAPAVPTLVGHFSSSPNATTLIPLLVTTPGLVVALLSPIAGSLIDKVGRRKPLLIAALFYALLGMAPLALNDLTLIFATRIGVGICEAFIIVASSALLTDYFAPDRRRFWLTVQSLLFPFLAAGVAALSGAFTAQAWNGAFICYAAVLPIALAIALYCDEPEAPSADTSATAQSVLAAAFPWKTTIFICVVTLLSSAMFYVTIVQIGLAYEAVGVTSAAQIGRYVALTTIAVPVGALVFNFASRRLSGEGLIASSLLFMGLAMVVIGLATTPQQVLIGGMLKQICAGMFISALIFWVSQVYPPEHRGRGFGFWSASSFAGQFLSPLIVGGTRAVTGGLLPTFLYLGIAVLAGSALLAAIGFLSHRGRVTADAH